MGGKKKLMRLIRGEKRDAARGSGFAHNLSGHGTLSLERQAGTLLKMMDPTECSSPISAYAHVHVRQPSTEDSSSSDDGFHTDAHHETDSDPGRDSLNSDDNIYENAYCSADGGGMRTKFIGSDDDFGGATPGGHSTLSAGLPEDPVIMGNHISSDMMTESEYATLPAITLRAAASRFKGASDNTTSTLQKKKQPNVMRVKKPGNRWATRISNDFFNRNNKKRGSSGRRKTKPGQKKIIFLNDFSPSSSTTDPHSPIGSDSDSLDSGRCCDTTSLHSTGSSCHATSADELESANIVTPNPTSDQTNTTASVKSHRRCPSISNISFSTINCQSPCGKAVPVIRVTPQKKLPSVDETPESQLSNTLKPFQDEIIESPESDVEKDQVAVADGGDDDDNNNNNNKYFDAGLRERDKNDGDVPKIKDIMQTRAPIYSVLHYVDHLKKQLSTSTLLRTAVINKSPQIKDGISPLSYLLRKLKLDLKMSYDSFVTEFVASPQDGIGLLVSLLRDIQLYQQSGTTTRRAKLEQYKKSLTDEHDCLLCIKFALRVEGGVEKLLDLRYGLETVTTCLLSSFSKARVTALEILTVSLGSPDGYMRVLDSMTHIRLKFGESVRFKLLVSMLNSQGSVYVLFQLVCMRFLNSLMTCTGAQNARVFLQYELEMAGLDMAHLEQNAQGDGLEYDDLRREVEIWKKRYVDVQGLQEELVTLQNRCSLLRHEVDSKEDRIKVLEDTQTELETQVAQLRESCTAYIAQNAALQENFEKLKAQYKKKGGKENREKNDASSSTEPKTTESEGSASPNKSQSVETVSITESETSDHFIVPVIIPPPPPLPSLAPAQPKRTLPVHPNVRLPLLNWHPLSTADNTVFQAMDEDQLYKELNLTEFEKRFELKSTNSSPLSSPSHSQKYQSKRSDKVEVLGSDRIRNLVITKRKIGLTGPEVRELVDQFDVDQLSGENAELLLRFLPTKDELKLLSKHSAQFSRLGEAEQFLYHLGHINDCKTKLTTMAFLGAFDDVAKSLSQQISVIQKASVSLLSSWKLRKLFQLILALGNYLNCQRRGVAAGFRLDSLTKLTELKSGDRKQTFVHYLTEMLETQFPSLVDWTDDLDIALPRSVSYQSAVIDLRNMRRGMEQVHTQIEKHPDVERLKVFHERASAELQRISAEFFTMEEMYEKACTTYGEKHTHIEPGDFFGHFTRFIQGYQKSCEDIHRSSGNNSAVNSPHRGVTPEALQAKRADFLAEAKQAIAQNNHRLASTRTLENGFSEIVGRKKAGLTAMPSPIPTLMGGGKAKVKVMGAEPYGLDLQGVQGKNDVNTKEIVNNWILQNTHSDSTKDSGIEDNFRTSTLKSTSSPERLPLPNSPGQPPASSSEHHTDTERTAASDRATPDSRCGEPSPDYSDPSSPANTISNASEISRVLREFEGNIHTLLKENNPDAKEAVPARPVDFYRPVTYL